MDPSTKTPPKVMEDQAAQAKYSPTELIGQLMNSNIPKSEREWAATRYIERLLDEVDELRSILAAFVKLTNKE